jgi:hypothetical protein
LDASGGGVFRNLIGAAQGVWNRAAASTPTLGNSLMKLQNRMSAIAKYREVTLFGKRNYELHSDKIVVVGAGMGSYEFEQTLLLTKISPNYIRLRIRPSIAWISLTISIVTGLLSVVLVREFAIRSAAIPGVLGIFSCSALIVAIATMKRVEYARFCSDGYGSMLLNVARSGPERNQFENFVQKLVSQIEPAKKLARAEIGGSQ